MRLKDKVIIVTGSTHGGGGGHRPPYSFPKGGPMTLPRHVADAYCPTGVRINQLNLGWILPESEKRIMTDGGLPADWWQNPPRDGAPTGRLMLPEEVAAA